MGTEKAPQAGVPKTYTLPGNAIIGIDHNDQMLKAISAVYGEGLKDKLPLVLYCDQTGNVFMFSSGYKIGVGEQILKIISTLQTNLKENTLQASCSK